MTLLEKLTELERTSEGRKYKSPANDTYLLDHTDALIAVARAARYFTNKAEHAFGCAKEKFYAGACSCGQDTLELALLNLGNVK